VLPNPVTFVTPHSTQPKMFSVLERTGVAVMMTLTMLTPPVAHALPTGGYGQLLP